MYWDGFAYIEWVIDHTIKDISQQRSIYLYILEEPRRIVAVIT